MLTEKRQVEGRDFWFSIERPFQPDPKTGDLQEAPGYYVAFSAREPSAILQGEIVKDDRNRARLFPSSAAALEAGIKEVKARVKIPATVFAVGLPGGTNQPEFELYTRLLRQEGIDPEAETRVEDSFGRKWLHVWGTREAAERFAARLRRETRNANWEVYVLNPLRPPDGEAVGSPGPIVILVGRQSDGNTYSLHPTSFKVLRHASPRSTLIRPYSSVVERRATTKPLRDRFTTM